MFAKVDAAYFYTLQSCIGGWSGKTTMQIRIVRGFASAVVAYRTSVDVKILNRDESLRELCAKSTQNLVVRDLQLEPVPAIAQACADMVVDVPKGSKSSPSAANCMPAYIPIPFRSRLQAKSSWLSEEGRA